MPSDLTPDISEQQAINYANLYLPGNEEINVQLMIIRPNYYWTYGMRYGFEQGMLCWVVIEGEDLDFTWVFVDANNGDILGGF